MGRNGSYLRVRKPGKVDVVQRKTSLIFSRPMHVITFHFIARALTDPRIHSPIHLLVYSLTQSPTDSVSNRLTQSLTHPQTRSSPTDAIHSCTVFTHLLFYWLTHSLTSDLLQSGHAGVIFRAFKFDPCRCYRLERNTYMSVY
jgi:hypothetical protein